MMDRWCRMCGKRISLAEHDLYGGSCNICSVGILDILDFFRPHSIMQALLRKLYIAPM